MSNSTLKILAIIFMTIDHIGHFMPDSPYYALLRMIGRLSFPIFLFLILQGYKYTSNIQKYMLNLFIFAIISVYPFYYAFEIFYNVFFTLTLVVLMLHLFTKTKNNFFNFFIFLLCFIISAPFDWGQPAILTVYLIKDYIYDDSKLAVKLPIYLAFSTWLYFVTEFKLSFIMDIFTKVGTLQSILDISLIYGVYIASILFSTPFLTAYNGKRGLKVNGFKKYLFYFYYPLHLIVIATYFKYL